MERYELAEIITFEDTYDDLPRSIDQLIPFLSVDALTHAIRQMRAQDPRSPHLETFEFRLSIVRKFNDPNFTPYTLKDVAAIMAHDLRQDLSPEDRRVHIENVAEYMQLGVQMRTAYKYN